jgi:hypothetical protein
VSRRLAKRVTGAGAAGFGLFWFAGLVAFSPMIRASSDSPPDPQLLSRYAEAEADIQAKKRVLERATEILDAASAVAKAAHDLQRREQETTEFFRHWAAAAQSYPDTLGGCGAAIARLIGARADLAAGVDQLRAISGKFNTPDASDASIAQQMDEALTKFYGLNEDSKAVFALSLSSNAGCRQSSDEQKRLANPLTGPMSNPVQLTQAGYRFADDLAALSSEADLFMEGTDVPDGLLKIFSAEGRLHDGITRRLVPYSSARRLSNQSQVLYNDTAALFAALEGDLQRYQTAAQDYLGETAADDYWQAGARVKAAACSNERNCMTSVDAQAANGRDRLRAARKSLIAAKSDVDVDAAELRLVIAQSAKLGRWIGGASQAIQGTTLIQPEEMQSMEAAVKQAAQWRDAALAQLQAAHRAADEAYLAAFGTPRAAPAPLNAAAAPGVGSGQFASAGSGHEAVAVGIRDHGYELIARFGDETHGYGAYTYVLFPRRVNDAGAPIAPGTEQRYKALLQAIYATTLERLKLPVDKAHWTGINLFCIPSLNARSEPTLDNYSTTIALQYLTVAKGGVIRRDSIMKMLAAREGPFLLTTFAPMNTTRTDAPLLLADLSDIPNDTFSTILGDYKLHLTQLRSVSDQQTWQPAVGQRAALLFVKLAPDVTDSMKWVKTFVGVSGKETAAGIR